MFRKNALLACIFACFLGAPSFPQTARNLEVEDLGVNSSPDAVTQAQAKFNNGIAILRVQSGTQQDIERLIGIPLLGATVKAATAQAPLSKAELLNSPSLQVTAAAGYKDEQGVVRSAVVFTATSPSKSTGSTSAESGLSSLNTWIQHEQARASGSTAESTAPEPPPAAWTAIYRTTLMIVSDVNSAELTIGVFRMNSTSLGKDFYLVATVPETKPAFDGTCDSAHCGWHTIARSTYMYPAATVPRAGGALVDHGPTGTTTESETSFDVGGDLTKYGPGVSTAYSEKWSTPSVVTTDRSDPSQGHWDESFQFSGNPCNPVSPPGSSTGTFLSRQAGIFQVPAATSQIIVPIEFDSQFCFFDPSNGPSPEHQGIVIQLSTPLGPPLLEAFPTNITIPAGGTGVVTVTASIPGSEETFSWTEASNQNWASTGGGGPFSNSRVLPVRIAPGTPDGSRAVLSIDTDPKYAAPSVRTGPLTVTITVGTPPKHPAGGVLLVGGSGATDQPVLSSQVYDYTSGNLFTTAAINVARVGHTATMLKDGRVLVVGGATKVVTSGHAPVTATAEIYNPSTMRWTPTGSLNTGRQQHTATRLPDGKVLITGGLDAAGETLDSAELYDPATGTFTAAGTMLISRAYHYADLIPNSGGATKVVIYGGETQGSPTNTSEVWDESTGAFTAASKSPRTFETPWTPNPVPLQPNKLDIVGGISEGAATGAETLLTLANPPFFSNSAASLNHPRFDHTLTALAHDEGLLVTGGRSELSGTTLQNAELRDSNGWHTLTDEMISPRYQHTATLLPDGRVFIAGGFPASDAPPNDTTELFDFEGPLFTPGPTITARAGHTATLFSTSTTDLVVIPSHAIVGQTVTLSAHVVTASGTSSGTVEFLDGSSVIATATLSGGLASASLHDFSVGSHTLTAVYGGDDTNGESVSNRVTLDVEAAGSSTALSSSPNPAEQGATVTFVATVQLQNGGVASGTVTLKDGNTVLGTAPLTDNQATFTEKSLTPGSHPITATYSGDATNSSSTSGVLVQVITRKGPPSPTTTSLQSSSNPAFVLQSVTFTATVTSKLGNITGTVTFNDNGKAFATVTLANGKAVTSTSSLTVGQHSITAYYSGDTNHVASTSPVLKQSIVTRQTTTTVTAAPQSAVFGQTVTLKSVVTSSSGGTATGSVTFKDGGTVLGQATLSNGAAVLQVSSLSVATHRITATYAGNQVFTGSSSPALSVTVAPAPTSTSLSSSANPSFVQQSITLTAAVTAPYREEFTGKVTFRDGATTIATVPINGKTATFSTSSLSVGTHNLTATYGSDANYTGSTSPVLKQIVVTRQTKTTVTGSPQSPVFGQTVTLTSEVTTSSGGTATGSVTFKDGGTVLGQATLSKGTAVLQVSSLNAATHHITATYSGNQVFTGSSSPTLSLSVFPAPTTTSLSSSLNPAFVQQSVTLTAAVAAPYREDFTGTVTFKDRATTIATVPVSGKTATFTTASLSAGTHELTATYGSDANYTGSTSPALKQVVVMRGTTTVVTESPPSPVFGQTVTLTGAVVSSSGGTPTGSVTFKDGGTVLGQATLSKGAAVLQVSSLNAATHSITGIYAGNQVFSGSSSPILSVPVLPSPTTISLSSSANPSFVQQSVTLTATVAAPYREDFTGTVTFKDRATTIATVPISGKTATFTTSSLALGTHNLTATYGSDPNYTGSTSPVLKQVVVRRGTTTTVTESPASPVFGQTVTLTGVVTSSSGGTATGAVTFKDGGTVLGQAALSKGAAVLQISSLSVASHNITAAYAGTEVFSGSSSPILTLPVLPSPTTASLSSSANPSFVQQSVTLTAAVSAPYREDFTGTLTFKDRATTIATVPISGKTATFTTSSLAVGTHNLTATYGSDANYTGSTSPVLKQNVVRKGTTTTVTGAPNAAVVNTLVNFHVHVIPALGSTVPTGGVVLKDGTSTLATLTLSGGTADFGTSSLSAGKHSITAIYGGDSDFDGSTSAAFTEVVNPLPTPTVVLTSTPNPSKRGQSVTFTAKVSGYADLTPRGSITISENLAGRTIVYGSAPLKNGVGVVTTDALVIGEHSIVATYGGEPNVYNRAASRPVHQDVLP
ncbi:MAG: Ig-like domain repeat protein [Acidobacteriaceae bacterium]|nr:Ig-like domain repeat protein [Acidobacteriaceae bacterium]